VEHGLRSLRILSKEVVMKKIIGVLFVMSMKELGLIPESAK